MGSRLTGRKAKLMVTVAALSSLLAACGNYASQSKQVAGPGASSPQAAVGNLLSALSQGRYDQALLDLAPGESSALSYPVDNFLSQLIRLGIVTPSTSLSHVPGVSVVFSNPTYTVTSIGNGIDFVQFTGGTVTGTATPSQLPIGATLQPVLGPVVGNAAPVTKTSPLASSPNAGLATVEQGGHWYVSLGYSIAEAARRSRNLPLPASMFDIASSGDSSADAAVKDFVQSAVEFDWEHVIALTPPDEEPALRDYASLFLRKVHEPRVKLTVDNLSTRDEAKPDGTMVRLTAVKIEGSFASTHFTYQNGCISVDSIATIQFCRSNMLQYIRSAHLPAAAADLVSILLSLRPDTGIMTVREGGKWYVSPVRTYLDDYDALLAALSRSDAERIVSDIKQLSHSLPQFPYHARL